ncbi:MAG: endolytic transglycosylase MltG [bacterium]|nr:endolytic transglycosylase MltG [bacterium]
MEKNRRAGIIKVLSLIVAVSILLLLLIVILSEAHKRRPYTSSTVSIPPGAGVRQIASILKSHRIIDHPLYFTLTAGLKGVQNSLKAGEYRFNNRMTTGEILDCLNKGKMITYSFTIPEGYNLKEIAGRLQDKGFVSSERFLSLCYDQNFIFSLGLNGESLEGYLFPDTYQAVKEISEKDIITVMVDRFRKITGSYQGKIKEMNTSLYPVITLASLIEKEVQKEEEKPLISAVFHNRLKKGMSLESCVTVLYALGYHKYPLTYDDLKIESPYNTYLHHGLPPGPICSPGRTSIEAALNPAPVPYLFFVARRNGFHRFSETYIQHRMAKMESQFD